MINFDTWKSDVERYPPEDRELIFPEQLRNMEVMLQTYPNGVYNSIPFASKSSVFHSEDEMLESLHHFAVIYRVYKKNQIYVIQGLMQFNEPALGVG